MGPDELRPTRFSTLVMGALALMLVVPLVACAPKRVQRGSAPLIPEGELPVDDGLLPPPEAHGRVDVPEVGDPETDPADAGESLENLRLGIEAAELARLQLNKPYQWGAHGPEKFDCSGLVFYVFGSLGVNMPRVSRDQARLGSKIGRSQLQPGDLVFFITQGKRINHVGIYIGDQSFIHAPSRHNPVRSDSLNNSYWRRCFQFGRRISR